MLFSFSLALVQGKDWGWTSVSIITLLLTSAISFIVFIMVELKVKNPMINLKLFKDRNFTGSSLALILCNYFLGGFVILIPTLLTKVYGHSELSAALLITPYSISVMFSVIITSLIIKKVNNKAIIAIGFLFIGAAYYMLANLNLDHNSLPLIYAGIVLGIGYGMVASAANILAASNFHGALLTDSQSVANVLRQVGMIISIAIFASLLTNNINDSKRHLISYSDNQVQKLDVQSVVKNKITKKIHHKLNPNNNNVSNANSNLNKNKFKVPNKKVKMIKSLAYYNALNQISLKTNVNANELPEATKKAVSAKVNSTVNQKTRKSH
ncbi:MFS transporter [Fructilactobacillus frigidiflavus]|uniref:MFS transporter n=1 Tax=Fructilactobacillus frigidiflavus TaxID=3242688 RepID=UPI0037570C47